jgi:FAD/FMN-containing dehydrogenase
VLWSIDDGTPFAHPAADRGGRPSTPHRSGSMDAITRPARGLEPAVGSDIIDRLRGALRGALLTPESPEYDRARAVWNAMHDRHPGLIARCAGAADVIAAVNFAREHRVALAVRGGGHNVAGSGVCDGGLVIDMSMMRSVRVDPVARTARVEPGCTLADVDRETQAFGLALPTGVNSTTGIAGLTLGGGFGWLSRRCGLTVDNLISADVVTADGALRRASETENADLFWAIRGGGGNFGVVTSFEYRLHEVGPLVLAGLVVHPLDDAPAVLRAYRDLMADAPDALTCWFVLRKAPPAPFLPPAWHGREILALAICWSGALDEGERVTAPLRRAGRPVADVVAPLPYAVWQTFLDASGTAGMRNYWKSHDVASLGDDLIDLLVYHARTLPDPQCDIAFAHLGGAVGRVPTGATAYGRRDAAFTLLVHGRWDDPARDGEVTAWARGVFESAAPFATGGVYVNFMSQDEGDRVRAAYGANHDRLVALKTRWDPTNLFRANQNIRPATPGNGREP